MPQLNILLAEDFVPFREFVCGELRRRPEFRVVAVADGLAAVQQAEELRPDLILLDISLPALDGLSAARRIRSLSPGSRIVFVTQEAGPDVIHEALNIGAQGYIHKTRARHLLPVVESMLGGSSDAARHGHQAQFGSDETTMLEAAECFLGSALTANDAAVAVTTWPHTRQLLQRLRNRGTDIDAAIARGSFVQVDAGELASRLLSDGVARWKPFLVQAIESAALATQRPRPRVAVFGECASMLWAAGHIDVALELERVGHQLVDTMPVQIMCAYSMLPFDPDEGFGAVCAHHGAVIIR